MLCNVDIFYVDRATENDFSFENDCVRNEKKINLPYTRDTTQQLYFMQTNIT